MSLVTEAQLRGVILVAEGQLDAAQAQLWQTVRIEPEVWTAPEGSRPGFGVWIVARAGSEVIWFDDASGLFQAGVFDRAGQIARAEGPLAELGRVLTGEASE